MRKRQGFASAHFDLEIGKSAGRLLLVLLCNCLNIHVFGCIRPRAHDFNSPPGFLLCPQTGYFCQARLQALGCLQCVFRTALFACLCLHPGCISLWGPDCLSWSICSRATSMRSAINSIGVGYPFVVSANLMVSRLGG